MAKLKHGTDRVKDVIQNLFEIQSAVHGYLGPETQQQLVRKMCATLSPLPFSVFSPMFSR